MSGTDLPQQSGWRTGAETPDLPQVKVTERAVLKKFDGDIEDGKLPVEVLLVEDGTITGHWAGEEVADAPEK